MAKKILVVDDEPVILKYLVLRLTRKGYDVVTAIDGEKAVLMAREHRPDLILLDIKLPKYNGYEVFRIIKADADLHDIPIIFSTADSTIGVQHHAAKLQAADYILKPFEAGELYDKVDRHAGKL